MLHGCYRQSWYLTPQLVILALADMEGRKEEREDLAKSLHSCPRDPTSLLKPVFPTLVWSADSRPPPLSSLVTPDSWTLFDRLALEGPNVGFGSSACFTTFDNVCSVHNVCCTENSVHRTKYSVHTIW